MKTIELKWIEDDNHVVAEDAYNGLKELIDTGVFPDLEVKCENDTLYITGEKEDLDKAVMKIQKAYAKYGQIMIKEAKNGVSQELRIESFDENVQDIFNHTLNDYNKFKSSKERPLNYVKQLNDYRFKFKKFYETAARSDKKLLKPYLDEISNLLDESEIITKIKPVRAKLEEDTMIQMAKDICEAAGKKVVNPENVDTIEDVEKELQELGYNEYHAKGLVKEYFKKAWRKLASGECAMNVAIDIDEDYMKESVDNELTKHLGNLKNWGVVENMNRKQYNAKYDEVALAYARETGMDLDDAYDELMDKDELVNWIEGPYDVDDIIYKLIYESTNMNRKQYNAKYDKVALAYARETGMDLDDAYDELMDKDELVNWIEGPYDVDEIVDKLMNESTKLTESFLSPGELKKKLQRVAARWASINGVKFEESYNELRKKKSVKDMLDFYSVDEIIDDLSKNKKEVDDELEEEI